MLKERLLDGVLRVEVPRRGAVPFVVDSPHSGTEWPSDFKPAAPESMVRRTQDSFVDQLFAAAPEHGAVLLAAHFPRVYIDPNRPLDDLDPELLAEPWPHPIAPGEKTKLGKGLIWRLTPASERIYDAPLAVADVERRIDRYYRPYHATLQEILHALHDQFGKSLHLNCHSMKSISVAIDKEGPGIPRPDIVLSDRDGRTCAPEVRMTAAEFFKEAGLRVSVNEPFKGAELIRAYADPTQGRHAIQIEINRRLYLDEVNLVPNEGFDALQSLLSHFLERMADLSATL